MDNEFLNLVSSPLMNLDHTYRYSGTKLVEDESLSQHIVDTIMMGLKIIDHINYLSGDLVLIPGVYVMKAIYHDLEECITGDIPRPLKYYNKDTLKSMRDVADKVAKEFFNAEFHVGSTHYWEWDNAKSGDEGYILKLVDTLVVANKVIKEVTMLNNMYMLKVAHEVTTYLEEQSNHLLEDGPASFRIRVREYLLSLIDGAISAMKSILDNHGDCLENLHIIKQSMI